jgi:hypothetical protein
VVLDLALELDEPAAELLAYRSMLVAVNSILHGPAQPQAVAPLRVVRACALRSAIGLVVAILIPPSRPLKKAHNRKRKPERNLMQIFVLPEKYPAVADRLTALNRKRGKLPDPHKLAEARSRHTELIASERYEGVKGLRHSIAPFGEVEPVECSDVFWLADQIDACVTELWLGIGLVRRPDRFPGEDAALFRETAAWQRRS